MYALLYRSRARPGLTASDLNEIIATALRRNAELGVTGLLLYGRLEILATAPGEFVQWIEGDEDAVTSLYEIIESDRRHLDVEVLARGSIREITNAMGAESSGERLFPAWSMGLVRLAELPATASGFLRFAATWDGQAQLAA